MESVVTDGAPNMRETQKGFVTLLQKSLDWKFPTFHCILHQKVLCTPPECMAVMNLVSQMVNKIIVKSSQLCKFCALLDEVNSTYVDLP